MTTYDLSKHKPSGSEYLFCPHCAAKNPRGAYCCLKCFKVMFPSPKFGFLGINIPTSVSVTIIFAALVFAALYLGNRWLSDVQGNMSLSIQTNAYNVAVTADKRRNEDLEQEISIEKTPPVKPSN